MYLFSNSCHAMPIPSLIRRASTKVNGTRRPRQHRPQRKQGMKAFPSSYGHSPPRRQLSPTSTIERISNPQLIFYLGIHEATRADSAEVQNGTSSRRWSGPRYYFNINSKCAALKNRQNRPRGLPKLIKKRGRAAFLVPPSLYCVTPS